MRRDTLFATRDLSCSLVDRSEAGLLEQAARIEQDAWGPGLGQDAGHMEARAANGFLIAAFRGGEIDGTISAVRRRLADVLAARDNPAHPLATWDGVSSRGTLARSEPDGDALVCVAISTRDSRPRHYPQAPAGAHPALEMARELSFETDAFDDQAAGRARTLADATIAAHIPNDSILRFHARPKCLGALGGAEVLFALPRGRPADLASMGYNVVMAYPELAQGFTPPAAIEAETGAGEALVVAAARLATSLSGVRRLVAFTRPAGFRSALIRALVAIGTESAPHDDPFIAAVRQALAR